MSRVGRSLGALVARALPLAVAASAGALPPLLEDPDRVVGPETCKTCHTLEMEAWLETAHARLYSGDEPLHTRERSREIAKNLGVRLIKHDSLCLDCHFTPERKSGRTTALAGVSCESCHGAARDWVHVHNNFEGHDVRRAAESTETRRRRVERNASVGMKFSGTPYELISSCFRCHTVPEERLVLDGGHTSGGTVSILERLESIRHNFVTGERRENAPFSKDRQRRYLVLAAAAELELQLRALAEAEKAGSDYVAAKSQRVKVLLRTLGRLQRRQPSAEIDALLGAAEGRRLDAGNARELGPAADLVAEIGRRFAREYAGEAGGERLAGLDPLLHGGDDESVAEPALGSLDQETEEAEAAATAPAPTTSEKSGAASEAPPPKPAKPQLPGKIKAQLRSPLSKRRTLGQGNCSRCHNAENAKWRGGRHETAANPFFDLDPQVRRFARTYYGRSVDEYLVTSRAVCMDCHGAVSSGASETESGPTCESCHGPAGDYVETHKDISRTERFALGVVDLRDAGRRADVCAGCHYILDKRLLAIGHPSGEGFDLAEQSRQIYHGKVSPPPDDLLASAWREVKTRLGPIPEVEVVTDAEPGRDRVDPASPDAAASSLRRQASSAPAVPPARPAYRGPGGAVADPTAGGPRPVTVRPIDLPPPLENADSLPLSEVLDWLRQRLDLLFRATGEP